MKTDWNAYRITLLLYVSILFFPISFYSSYNSFTSINTDTKVLKELTLIGGSIVANDNKKKIDSLFKTIEPWIALNNVADYYVGSKPLVEKFDDLKECYKMVEYSNNSSTKCFEIAKSLSFSVENMLIMKQKNMYNSLYINLFATMALILTLIFFTRAYIHKQLNRHAIYDFKTKLFNKDYLLATIKELSARIKRNEECLNLIYMKAENLDDASLNHIGSVFINSVRASDIACRYSENEFVIILPDTNTRNTLNLLTRIDNQLDGIKYMIKSIEHSKNESYEDFILRLSL